jgi:putative FmdB family regulatory protein
MPFYEYECSACKFYVEVLQKISDAPLKKCPSCKKSALKKLVSAPVFRLKGSGWYETDFKSDQDKKRNLVDDKDSSSASDSKTDNATESKADKTESKTDSNKEKATESKSTAEKSASKSASKGGKAAEKKPSSSGKAKPKPAAKKK